MRSRTLPAAIPILFALASTLLSPTALRSQADPLAGLDEFVRESMDIWNVPGAAVAVVKDDRVVFVQGFGSRQVGKDAPVTPDTVFPIASNTKALAAAAVATLVEDGTLAWNDAVTKHLPDFQPPEDWRPNVTIRDALSSQVYGRFVYGSGYHIPVLLAAVLGGMDWNEIRPVAAGESNFSPEIRRRWNEFLHSRIFEPLAMTSASRHNELWDAEDLLPCTECTLDHTVEMSDARVDDITMVHTYDGAQAHATAWAMNRGSAAGGYAVSVRELTNWMRMLLGEGTYEGRQILSPEVARALLSPHGMATPRYPEIGEDSGRFWTYGFGWYITDYRGRLAAIHSGGTLGARSTIALLPEEKVGVAVVSNVFHGLTGLDNGLPENVAFEVLDRYVGAPPTDRNARRARAEHDRWRLTILEELETERVEGTSPSLPVEAYVGTFVAGEEKLRIALEGDRLTYHFENGPSGQGVLEHWHFDVFSQRGLGPSRFVGGFFSFVLGATGEVEAVRFSLRNPRGLGRARTFERARGTG